MRTIMIGALAGAALVVSGGAARADVILPATFSATLGIGESVDLAKTVTVDSGPGVRRGDILFMADTTGSMFGTIDTVQTNFSAIIAAITATPGSYAFGAAEYKDLGDGLPIGGGSYRLNAAITADGGTAAQTGIGAWAATGGGDTPEQGLFALKIASDAATGWRAGAEKIIVIAGDASSHEGAASADGATTVATAKAALVAAGVNVQTIDVGSMNADGQFDGAGSIYAAPGGVAGGYRTSFGGTLVDDILAAIDTAFTTYSTIELALDPSSGDCVSVGGLGTIGSGSFDRSVARDFAGGLTFTGVNAGECTVTINALVDGAIVAQEVDTFRVGTDVPVPATLSLLGLGLIGLAAIRRRR